MTIPRRRREFIPTEFIPIEGDNDPLRSYFEARDGHELNAIEVAPHREGSALVPGRVYLSRRIGWSRCVEGAGGPYLPTRDGHPPRDDGSHEIIGWIAFTHHRCE